MPSARSAYTTAPNVLSHRERISDRIRRTSYEKIYDVLSDACSSHDLSTDLSSYLVVLEANAKRSFQVRLASVYIFNLVYEHHLKDNYDRTVMFYELFCSPGFSRTPAGWLLDHLFHRLLRRGGQWPLSALEEVSREKQIHWVTVPTARATTTKYLLLSGSRSPCASIHGESVHDPEIKPLKFVEYTPQDFDLRDNQYHKPVNRNEATFDSFIFVADSSLAIVFQAASNPRHTVKAQGFKRLRDMGIQEIWFIALTPPLTTVDLVVEDEAAHLVNKQYHLVVHPHQLNPPRRRSRSDL